MKKIRKSTNMCQIIKEVNTVTLKNEVGVIDRGKEHIEGPFNVGNDTEVEENCLGIRSVRNERNECEAISN